MNSRAISFDDVLLIPQYNEIRSRRDVDTSFHFSSNYKNLHLKTPIFSSNMDMITEHEMAQFMHKKGGIGVLHRFMTIDRNVEEYKLCQCPVAVSIGITDGEEERFEELRDAGAYLFCLDVAHAHSLSVKIALQKYRKMLHNNEILIVGNVATAEGARFLEENGADIIKVGISIGGVCLTSQQAGHGVPSLTTIQECASTVNVPIIADGGIRKGADFVKALAFGADAIMIGGMLSGCKSTPGEVIEVNGDKFKKFRGMASKEAQEDFFGSMSDWKTSEGASLLVKFNETEDEIIDNLMGGLRSGLTYSGARNIHELQQKMKYNLISHSAFIEGTAHKMREENLF